MQAMTSQPKMALRIKRNRKTVEIPVETVNQASAVWGRIFQEMLASGEDMIPDSCRTLIVDGEPRGYVSQNGKVWEGSPREWKSGTAPLFDPAAEA